MMNCDAKFPVYATVSLITKDLVLLVPRHPIFRTHPAALSKNKVWTRSLVNERIGMLRQSDCSGKVNCVMRHQK